MVVSSIETLSTQSNSSPIGRLVEDLAGALADQRLQLLQVGRRDDRADGLALHVVLGRVHGDEHRQAQVRRPGVGDGDAAQCASEENTWWLVSTAMMSLYLVTDQ